MCRSNQSKCYLFSSCLWLLHACHHGCTQVPPCLVVPHWNSKILTTSCSLAVCEVLEGWGAARTFSQVPQFKLGLQWSDAALRKFTPLLRELMKQHSTKCCTVTGLLHADAQNEIQGKLVLFFFCNLATEPTTALHSMWGICRHPKQDVHFPPYLKLKVSHEWADA